MFEMSPEQLRQKSADLMAMANKFLDLINHMDGDQKKLSSNAWVSESSVAYSNEFKTYLPMLQDMQKKMISFSKFFEEAANSTDRMNKNIINSING